MTYNKQDSYNQAFKAFKTLFRTKIFRERQKKGEMSLSGGRGK